MSPRKTVYFGTFLHSAYLGHIEVSERTAIGVDEEGIITFIENNLRDEEAILARIDGNGWDAGEYDLVEAPEDDGVIRFWFPGFIDTHIHAPQFPNAGIFGKTTLMDWLEKYTFPLESSLASLPRARNVYSRCIRRTLAHGTTTAAYFATTDVAATNVLADLCKKAGQRAFIGRCNMDSSLCPTYYRDASAEAALAATEATIAHIASIDPTHSLISPILTPRFAPSCSRELMRGLGKLHEQHALPIQTHISENDNEIATAREMFPEHGSYAAIYDAAGLLTPRTVLAHGVHLGPDEVQLIQQRGAAIAHCPISNSCLGSGICPVRELLEAAVPVGLGTDVSGGYSPSILAACREAGSVSRLRTAPDRAAHTARAGSTRSAAERDAARADQDTKKLSVEETLHMATRGGARCLGLQARVGGFSVGMEWDAQFVELGREIAWEDAVHEDPDAPPDTLGDVAVYEGMSWSDRLAKWVFGGDERNTRAVWVKGRLVSGQMERVQ